VGSRMTLDNAQVLDLYAGSGALGLEALSRGAGHARFVESDRRAAAVLRRNATELGFASIAEITVASVRAVLAGPPAEPCDLVLADPPYSLGGTELAAVLDALSANRWLSPGALLVIERSARDSAPAWPNGVSAVTERRYGDTLVYYGQAP
jgi:16S rRNA (guanine966-N2)-methyltransferase